MRRSPSTIFVRRSKACMLSFVLALSTIAVAILALRLSRLLRTSGRPSWIARREYHTSRSRIDAKEAIAVR